MLSDNRINLTIVFFFPVMVTTGPLLIEDKRGRRRLLENYNYYFSLILLNYR